MVWLDFLNVIQHKCLIVLTIYLIRFQCSDAVVNINQAGLGQPFRCRELTQHKVKHQHQGTIAFNCQVVNKQFLIDGLNDFSSFNYRLLVEILGIKYLNIKTKAAHAVVPQFGPELNGAILQAHTIPSKFSALINFKLVL